MCALFVPESVGGVKLDRLVKSPLQLYTTLTGKAGYLSKHLKHGFDKDSAAKAKATVDMTNRELAMSQSSST